MSKTELVALGRRVVQRVLSSVEDHPKTVVAIIAGMVVVGGGGSLALASIERDPVADMPITRVTSRVQSLASGIAAEALVAPELSLYRTERARASDTVSSLLRRMGVVDADAVDFMRRNALMNQNIFGRIGRVVTVETGVAHTVKKLVARWVTNSDSTEFQRLVMERTAGDEGFTVRLESLPLQASTRLVSGEINSSLYAATDALNIPDAIANQIAEIFSVNIDFRRDLRKGDRFSVVYETLSSDDGEPLRSGRVLSAQFVNKDKVFDAVWFKENGSAKGHYFSLDGESLQRAFLASPLAFTRVTSGFTPRRFHPIQQRWKAHLGTDMAAPTGTPVRVAGDGEVTFAGWQNGYGNVVFVKHRGDKVTVYAHMSQIYVKKGQRVVQGENVGAVGMTGWATGPHLHYEVRVNGKHQDPMRVAQQSEAIPVSRAARAEFDQLVAQARVQLRAAQSVQMASVE